MRGRIGILCAMRDQDVVRRLQRELEDERNCCIRHAACGEAALEEARREEPDIMVIDALLPKIDGLGVIDRLRAQQGDRMPRIIGGSMMTFSDEGFSRRGVRVVLRMPWEYARLRGALMDQMEEIRSGVDWQRAQPAYERANALLDALGMHAMLKGRAYLAWAAALVYRREARRDAVGKRLYVPIAERFGTTPQSVERLIRHAVESTMNTARLEAVYAFFGNSIDPTRGKPTNAQSISALAQHLRVQETHTDRLHTSC